MWTSTNAGPYRCRACMGGGIIWGPNRAEWESNDEQSVIPYNGLLYNG